MLNLWLPLEPIWSFGDVLWMPDHPKVVEDQARVGHDMGQGHGG